MKTILFLLLCPIIALAQTPLKYGRPWHGVNMLENKGNMQYIKHDISKNPTHLLSCEPGDFNNDGLIDLVTGGMHTYPPYDRMGRITLWINNGKLSEKK